MWVLGAVSGGERVARWGWRARAREGAFVGCERWATSLRRRAQPTTHLFEVRLVHKLLGEARAVADDVLGEVVGHGLGGAAVEADRLELLGLLWFCAGAKGGREDASSAASAAFGVVRIRRLLTVASVSTTSVRSMASLASSVSQRACWCWCCCRCAAQAAGAAGARCAAAPATAPPAPPPAAERDAAAAWPSRRSSAVLAPLRSMALFCARARGREGQRRREGERERRKEE